MTVYVGIFVTAFSVWIVAVIVLLAKRFRSHPLLPDRWTRGFTRWWARCRRWTGRIGPGGKPERFNEPVITQEQMRQVRAVGRAVARTGDRPTPAEFAAAPLYGPEMVYRLLKDLDDAGGR